MLRYARSRLIPRGPSTAYKRASSGDALKQHSIHRGDAPKEPEPLPKPPLLHRISFFLRLVLIPGTLVYSVFYADWGEGDHVFRLPRKWLEEQKAAFFELSPEERKLVESDAQSRQTPPENGTVKPVN